MLITNSNFKKAHEILKLVKEEISKEILRVLREAPFGLTILELAEKLGNNRNTIAKYLEVMEAKSEVFYRQIGVYRIWFSFERSEKTFRESQEKYGKYFLSSLNKVLRISKEQADKIGKEIALQLFNEQRYPIPEIIEFPNALHQLKMILEIIDQAEIEIIDANESKGVMRLKRSEDLSSESLNWLFEVERSLWQNLIELHGIRTIRIFIKEFNNKFIDFEFVLNNSVNENHKNKVPFSNTKP